MTGNLIDISACVWRNRQCVKSNTVGFSPVLINITTATSFGGQKMRDTSSPKRNKSREVLISMTATKKKNESEKIKQ